MADIIYIIEKITIDIDLSKSLDKIISQYKTQIYEKTNNY